MCKSVVMLGQVRVCWYIRYAGVHQEMAIRYAGIHWVCQLMCWDTLGMLEYISKILVHCVCFNMSGHIGTFGTLEYIRIHWDMLRTLEYVRIRWGRCIRSVALLSIAAQTANYSSSGHLSIAHVRLSFSIELFSQRSYDWKYVTLATFGTYTCKFAIATLLISVLPPPVATAR